MKKKSTIYILSIVLILLTIFNFVATQTNVLQKYFGLYLNSRPVLVATKTLHQNDPITEDAVIVKYVSKDFFLKNPDSNDTSTYVLTDKEQLKQGLIAKETILAGEQIAVKRLLPASELENTKTSIYPINIDYLGAAGNTLYVGDNAELWYKYKDKDNFVTDKLFNDKITVTRLKNSDGVDVNKDRNQVAVIPSLAFIRVEDSDIKKIEDLKNKGAIFFFVKEAN